MKKVWILVFAVCLLLAGGFAGLEPISITHACDEPDPTPPNITIDNIVKSKSKATAIQGQEQKQQQGQQQSLTNSVNQGDVDVEIEVGDTTVGGIVTEDKREYLQLATYIQPPMMNAPDYSSSGVLGFINEIIEFNHWNNGFTPIYMQGACDNDTSDVSIATCVPLPKQPRKTKILWHIPKRDDENKEDPFYWAWLFDQPSLFGQANVTLNWKNAYPRLMALGLEANRAGADYVILSHEIQPKNKGFTLGLGFGGALSSSSSGATGGMTMGPGYGQSWQDVNYHITALLYTWQDVEHALFKAYQENPSKCRVQKAFGDGDGKR